MTFKIEISQFYDYSGPEQWKLNKNKNQTFFSWDIFKSGTI